MAVASNSHTAKSADWFVLICIRYTIRTMFVKLVHLSLLSNRMSKYMSISVMFFFVVFSMYIIT